jgi:adenosylcobinamide-GDP ribazoletransferase
VRDALRLALGTLTIVPVRPPVQVDRRTGGRAMVLAPLVGALLGGLLVGALWLCRGLPPLVAATLAVSLLAVLTRGIHLDGLADTADGLGSGRLGAEAVEVMRKGDVGPFGVVTVVLALLLQVGALAGLLTWGSWALPVVLAVVTSRLALPMVCLRGVPAARTDGLGSTVAGSVSRTGLVVAVLLAAVPVAVVAGVSGGPAPASPILPALAVLVPLLLAGLLALRCVRRLGGVTGDVLGACVEVTLTASLVVLSVA